MSEMTTADFAFEEEDIDLVAKNLVSILEIPLYRFDGPCWPFTSYHSEDLTELIRANHGDMNQLHKTYRKPAYHLSLSINAGQRSDKWKLFLTIEGTTEWVQTCVRKLLDSESVFQGQISRCT